MNADAQTAALRLLFVRRLWAFRWASRPEQLTGTDMVHVPYKNQPQIMTDLIGGHIDAAIEFPSVAVPHVKAGKCVRWSSLALVGSRQYPRFLLQASLVYQHSTWPVGMAFWSARPRRQRSWQDGA
jgi:hypothetical protein